MHSTLHCRHNQSHRSRSTGATSAEFVYTCIKACQPRISRRHPLLGPLSDTRCCSAGALYKPQRPQTSLRLQRPADSHGQPARLSGAKLLQLGPLQQALIKSRTGAARLSHSPSQGSSSGPAAAAAAPCKTFAYVHLWAEHSTRWYAGDINLCSRPLDNRADGRDDGCRPVQDSSKTLYRCGHLELILSVACALKM